MAAAVMVMAFVRCPEGGHVANLRHASGLKSTSTVDYSPLAAMSDLT